MLNRAIMMGRLTYDPELKTTQAGTQLCRFSITYDRDFENADGEKETDLLDCVIWRKATEFVSQCLAKGRMIVVEGWVQNRSRMDRKGNKRRGTEIIVGVAHFGDSEPRREDDESLEPPTGGGDGFGFPGGLNPGLSGIGGGVGSNFGADSGDDELPSQHTYNWRLSATGVSPVSAAERHHIIGGKFVLW